MNFWERVYELTILKNVERKYLGIVAGFDPSNIGKGIKKNSVPSADTALKIANCLGVSVNYLVTGIPIIETNVDDEFKTINKICEYRKLIKELETFSPEVRNYLLLFVDGLSKNTNIREK